MPFTNGTILNDGPNGDDNDRDNVYATLDGLDNDGYQVVLENDCIDNGLPIKCNEDYIHFLRFSFSRKNLFYSIFSSDQFSTILAISRWSTSSPKVFLASCTISRVVLKTGDGVSLSWNIAIQVSISLNNQPKEKP